MSRTGEIADSIRAIGVSVGQQRSRTEQIGDHAREQIEIARIHGWGGVARSPSLILDPLDQCRSRLTDAETACAEACSRLAEISGQPGITEVERQLAMASGSLGTAWNQLNDLVDLVEQAQAGAARATHRRLFQNLETLAQEMRSLISRLEQRQTDVADELGASRWESAERRERWARDRLKDPGNIYAQPSTEPWADYQRKHAGPHEVDLHFRVRPGENPDGDNNDIWADGLVVDPDTVVAVEAKYVGNPGRSLWEGNIPARMQDRLMTGFDGEMRRYRRLVADPANPVRRIRIVTNSPGAVDYLEQRARQILGPSVDLDVVRRDL